MNKTAIIYSFNTKKTGKDCQQIQEGFNDPIHRNGKCRRDY